LVAAAGVAPAKVDATLVSVSVPADVYVLGVTT